MAESKGGAAQRRRKRDEERAARMKALGIVRTTGRCAVCYRIVTVDSWKSRYTHICARS
jgi:hypothetical protein